MISNLTPKAVEVIKLAKEEAVALKQTVAPAHLFLGILRVGTGVACTLMDCYDMTLDALRECLIARPPTGDIDSALRAANEHAKRAKYNYVGMEHIMSSLLTDCPSAQPVLEAFDLPAEELLEELLKALNPNYRKDA